MRRVSASERVVLASIGLGGRGGRLITDFAGRADTEIAHLCDLDAGRAAALVERMKEKKGRAPRPETDYRRVLDDPSVDAIIAATPDHWHALLTVEGCQAGKDVYVEKPASHNVWAGRKMVEAARKYDRVVQVGTQNRSAPYNHEALELIRGGGLGKIHLCKVYNLKPGGPFRLTRGRNKPEGVDYDRWLGPCARREFSSGHFHGAWYYFWDFCGGDMGNDSSHQIDIARWFIDRPYPESAYSTGGNFAFPDDDREVPDTQVATFEYDDLVLTVESTNWPPYMKKTNNQVRTGDHFPAWLQNATRIELYGTKNLMVLGRHGGGWQVFTADGKVVSQMFGRFPDAAHQEDFLRAVRTRSRPSADVEEGHRSAIISHLANISYRLGGRKLRFDGETETIVGDAAASRLLKREYREPYVIPEEV